MAIYTFLMDLNSVDNLKIYISNILDGLNYISYEGRNVNIAFNNSLSIEDKVILENAMVNYTNPIDIIINRIEQIVILNRQCSSTSYSLISEYLYNINNGIINSIQIKCNISDINETYNLRIYDVNNNIILGELTNLNNIIHEIKTINITPSTNTILELQCYVSTNSVICDIISIYNIY